MHKSFKFVLFNESFPKPTKFQIRPNFGRSRISAGFVKKAGFQPEPNSGTALLIYTCTRIHSTMMAIFQVNLVNRRHWHDLSASASEVTTVWRYRNPIIIIIIISRLPFNSFNMNPRKLGRQKPFCSGISRVILGYV